MALGMAWSGFGAGPASAQSAGLQFSIGIPGLPGCDTRSGDATCNLAPGSTFVIDVSLDSLPSNVPRYTGYDITLGYGGVTPQGEPGTETWPDCAYSVVAPPRAEGLLFGCAAGLPPHDSSAYIGPIGTASFLCSQSGSVRLLHGETSTDLGDAAGVAYTEAGDAETLTIKCVAGGAMPTPPTPVPPRAGSTLPDGTGLPPEQTTATAPSTAAVTAASITPTPGAGEASDGNGGVNGGLIAIIIVVAVAGAGGLGFLGWRILQNRRGGGGGT